MKRIVVTPVGGRQFLGALAKHLAAQKDAFDEWHLWVNTSDVDDQQAAVDLNASLDWVRIVTRDILEGCVDPGAVYMSLDADVAWLEAGFLARAFAFRLDHPEASALVLGNVVNDAGAQGIHDRMGRAPGTFQPGAATDWHFPMWRLDEADAAPTGCRLWLGSTGFPGGGSRVIYGGACCLRCCGEADLALDVPAGRGMRTLRSLRV